MPSKTFKYLTENQQKFVDQYVQKMNPSLSDNSKTINQNAIKKVLDYLKWDPLHPLELTTEELTEKIAEAVHTVNQPSEAYIRQNTRRILEFINATKKDIEEESKTPQMKKFERMCSSREFFEKCVAKGLIPDVEEEEIETGNNEEEEEEDEDETANDIEEMKQIEIAEENKHKKRKIKN